jgi:L-fuconolactonase
MIIDAHHHLWKYNDTDYVWMSGAMDKLRRDFLTEHARDVMGRAGVDGAVTVQARQSVEETEWLLELAGRNAFMRGVVGWVPLTSPDARRQLERFAGQPKLKAVRHVLHDEPDDHYMLRDDFNRGVGLLREFDLVYDILIFERHLPQTIEFVDRHPDQVFVLDHVAKPRIRDRVVSPWRENIHELSKRQNLYCKLSGMVTEADWSNWSIGDFRPYFEIVLSAFGPSRLMFGSDWPVLTLASDYGRWVEVAGSLIAELSPGEQERILYGTAVEAYKL